MKVKQALERGAEQLNQLDNPRREAEVLLMHALGWDRSKLYTNLDKPVGMLTSWRYWRAVEQRKERVPSAYILKKREFCGFDFWVTPAVLIPRPETEALVYRAIELIRQHHYRRIFDVGTGCGNIAISIAKQTPKTIIVASDISGPSLKIAQKNVVAHRLSKRISLAKSSFTSHIDQDQADLIVANLPYVPDFFEVSAEVAKEPRLAIFDQAYDGLGLYRVFFQGDIFNSFKGRVLIELRPTQFAQMAEWLKDRFPKIKISPIKDIDGQIWGLEADFS
jgi:release factor glutamine methyltransferase